MFCFLPFWHELILPRSLARCIYFVLGLKILGLWQNSSWHIYVIYNITLYLPPHWLWFCGALNTSFSHFLNRFRCKVFIPFDQTLCELKRPKLRTIKIPKYFLPFEIFAMLPLWSTWLDNWYHLTMLIIIINSVIDMFPLSHLFFFPVSHNEHFPFMCNTDTCYSFMLSKPAVKTFLIQEKQSVKYTVTNEVLNSISPFLKILRQDMCIFSHQ